MNNLEIRYDVFENIKHNDEYGNEYWLARELQKVLGYNRWENFHKVIKSSIMTCNNSGILISDHFREIRKMVEVGSKTKRQILEYKLSRYACYLIAQNGDHRKKVISLAKTYFALQTRKMEIVEQEYSKLTEDEKRLYQRQLTKKGNYSLNQTAKKSGVKNFDKYPKE